MTTFRQKKRSAEFRAEARSNLTGNWGIAVGAFLLFCLLGGAITKSVISVYTSDIKDQLTDFAFSEKGIAWVENFLLRFPSFSDWNFALITLSKTVGTVLVVLYALFVGAPAEIGYRRLVLDINDKKKASAETLFFFFSPRYGKSLVLRAVRLLLRAVCSLPELASVLLGGWYLYGQIVSMADRIRSFPDLYSSKSFVFWFLPALFVFSLILFAGWVIRVVLNVLISYRFAFASYILAEHPDIGAIDALRYSNNLMAGNKWKLFCLRFSFIGWFLLSVLSCGIGLIWIFPYLHASEAAFYHHISNREEGKNTEFPSLNPDDYVTD